MPWWASWVSEPVTDGTPASEAVAPARSGADAMLPQRVVERGAQVGRLAPLADHVGAGQLGGPARELAGTGAGHDHGPLGDLAVQRDGREAAQVDDGDR